MESATTWGSTDTRFVCGQRCWGGVLGGVHWLVFICSCSVPSVYPSKLSRQLLTAELPGPERHALILRQSRRESDYSCFRIKNNTGTQSSHGGQRKNAPLAPSTLSMMPSKASETSYASSTWSSIASIACGSQERQGKQLLEMRASTESPHSANDYSAADTPVTCRLHFCIFTCARLDG